MSPSRSMWRSIRFTISRVLPRRFTTNTIRCKRQKRASTVRSRCWDLRNACGHEFFRQPRRKTMGDPSVHPQTEDSWGHVSPISPRSCYDEGKRCAEALGRAGIRAKRSKSGWVSFNQRRAIGSPICVKRENYAKNHLSEHHKIITMREPLPEHKPDRPSLAPSHPRQRLRTRRGHLAIGPVFEISDRKAFKKWVGFNELLSIGSARCVGAGHN